MRHLAPNCNLHSIQALAHKNDCLRRPSRLWIGEMESKNTQVNIVTLYEYRSNSAAQSLVNEKVRMTNKLRNKKG